MCCLFKNYPTMPTSKIGFILPTHGSQIPSLPCPCIWLYFAVFTALFPCAQCLLPNAPCFMLMPHDFPLHNLQINARLLCFRVCTTLSEITTSAGNCDKPDPKRTRNQEQIAIILCISVGRDSGSN